LRLFAFENRPELRDADAFDQAAMERVVGQRELLGVVTRRDLIVMLADSRC
jgi:hypothetical protein